MKKIVIIPGGFHPYHAGHRALYDAAREAFPSADVFVAATDDTSERPFPFKTKRFLAQQAGIPGNRFIRVKSPFRAEEITQMYDPDDTVLIFVRSEKDAQKQPQAGGVKKDGSAAYLQPYKRNGLEPFRQHGYMAYLPTVQFGPGMTSATEIRAKWPEMTLEEKISLVKTMYPSTVNQDAAAGKIVSMLDEIMMGGMAEGMNGAQASLMGAATGAAPSLLNPTPTPMANAADRPRKGVRMGVEFDEADKKSLPAGSPRSASLGGYNTSFLQKIVTTGRPINGITPAQALAELRLRAGSTDPHIDAPTPEFTARYLQGRVKEATIVNDPDAGLQIRPAGGMGTWDEQSLVSNLARKFASMVDMVRNKNYTGLYHVLYQAGVVENMVRALAELEAFQARQGRRPIARGREIDTTDYLEER